MVRDFRILAGLFLLAGVCLGVFANSLVARPPQSSPAQLDPRIETQVEHYRERFDLDAARTDAVRRELVRFHRAVQRKRYELQLEHQDEFRALTKEAGARIRELIGAKDGGSAEALIK